MLWLGERRGYLSDWITQQWVRATGRSLDDHPHLLGPVGTRRRIGFDQPEQLADALNLTLDTSPSGGLLQDSAALFPGIHPRVAEFYDETSHYELQVWSSWRGPFRPFGQLLGALFSRRLEQMNVPLDGLDTAWGLHGEVTHLRDPSGRVQHTVWRRRLRRTGRVLFVGYYSEVTLPDGPGVRIVFPLPGGNLTVLMAATVGPAGELQLSSNGRTFGGAGGYFTLAGPPHRRAVGRMIPLHEDIVVWVDERSELRARHTLRLWHLHFLELQYLMRRTDQPTTPL